MQSRKLNLIPAASVIFAILISTLSVAIAAGDSPDPYRNGIWAEYYSGTNFGSYLKGQKESVIDNAWTAGNTPAGQSSQENFSVRWSGRLLADETGNYGMIANIDDGAKVWLDGKLIINDSGPHLPEESSALVSLTAGTYYDLKIEYYNGAIDGTAQLFWKKPSGQKELIPAENFFMPDEANVTLVVEDNEIFAQARMQNESGDPAKLVIECYDQSGALTDRRMTVRPGGNQMIWESEKMIYSENNSYKAYAADSGTSEKVISNTETKTYGIDTVITVNPEEMKGEISPYLYGACIEDVNHELYGGIWSQMIFGESFAEPAVSDTGNGFTAAGGEWETENAGGINQLTVSQQNNGPKLIIDNTECESGSFSADVLLSDGEGPVGFIVKVSDAREGADSFNGYEIGISNNLLRIGRHEFNYGNVGDYPCSAPAGTWVNLRVEMESAKITVYVNDSKITEYTDPKPFVSGTVGFRAWNASAKFKNIKFAKGSAAPETVDIPEFDTSSLVSGMWKAAERGTAAGKFEMEKTAPYNGTQSQRITFQSGTGAAGIHNMGLNRKGMNFESGKEYEGYFYARSNTPVTAYVVLENAGGTVRYAETAIDISGDGWNKYGFTVTPNAKDTAGRLTIELRSSGSLDLGYVYFQPGEWGRYQGLPVRKDVAEKLIEQGVTVLRFGGCMANAGEYKWKKMLGTPEERPSYNGWWYPYSSFGFGIMEFLDLCEALGVAAVPDFNSYETPEDMADFIDFATGTDPDNQWVQKRIEMGHPEPYALPYLEFGNEERVDGAYAARFNAMAQAVWAKDQDIILVVGDFDYKQAILDPYNFTGSASGITTLANHKAILDLAAQNDREVWFDIHFWTNNAEHSYSFFEAAISLYHQLKTTCPDARFKLPIFELNADRHTLERALGNAYAINRGERHGEIFPIITSANCLQVDRHNDNGWDQGLIFMNNDSAWLQPPGYVTQMAAAVHQPYLIAAEASPIPDNLDFTATRSEDGKTVAVKFVNQAASPVNVQLYLSGFTGDTNRAVVRSLTAGSITAANTAADPYNVVPTARELENPVKGSRFSLSLEPNSYTVIEIEALSDPSEATKGDVNGDGSVNALDIMLIRKHMITGGDINTAAADMNYDGKIDALDIMLVRKLLLAAG